MGGLTLCENSLEVLYRQLMPQDNGDPEVEAAADKVYNLLGQIPAALFGDLEEAVNAYTAATEKRGFKEGIKAGADLAVQVMARSRK